ncbi:hypothetical protein BaRGS_00005861 [Batillaria attramentaria]|uniref:Uncharacterized protein n=1 Tax=Batillaria attramentaria TaxID=370345 RepID=A0ABD0LUD7_9CAEN
MRVSEQYRFQIKFTAALNTPTRPLATPCRVPYHKSQCLSVFIDRTDAAVSTKRTCSVGARRQVPYAMASGSQCMAGLEKFTLYRSSYPADAV